MPPFDGNLFAQLPSDLHSTMQDLAASAWQMPLETQRKRVEPLELILSDVFRQPGVLSSDSSVDDIENFFKNASNVDFSTAEMNKLAGEQPDFVIDAAGNLTKNPNVNWKPGDKLNVEIQSVGSQLVSRVQESVIQSIIDIFLSKHPDFASFPRTWQQVIEALRNSMTGQYANSSNADGAAANASGDPSASADYSNTPNVRNGGKSQGGSGAGAGSDGSVAISDSEALSSTGSDIRPENGLAPPVAVAGKVFPVDGYNGAKVGLHHGSSDGAADIFATEGTPIRAMVGGEVVSVGSGGLGGNTITIRQADGKIAYYAHMQAKAAKNDGTPIEAGDRIETGDMIGRVGQTGNAAGTGAHLHLGVGDDIQGGSGPEGGAGTNFNLVGTINAILGMS